MRKTLLLCAFMLCFADQDLLAGEVGLKGSPASLQRQRQMAVVADVPQIQGNVHLRQLQRAGMLVPLLASDAIRVDPRLGVEWRWLRPEALQLLEDLGKESIEKFGIPIQVNSAVRTVPRQIELQGSNANAASVKFASHTRGTTFDLARFVWVDGRRVWYPDEHQEWLEGRLLELEEQGLIEATREENQAVYHVTVSPDYGRPGPDWMEPFSSSAPAISLTLSLVGRGGICLLP